MKLLRYTLILALFCLGPSLLGHQPSPILTMVEKQKDSGSQGLSVTEWKKFRNFERKLIETSGIQTQGEDELRAYTRDSLRILEVKLMAIKLLDEKKLLDRDITEHFAYYNALIDELHESSIPQSEYRFLEEKVAFLNQGQIEEKLALNRGVILVLVLVCMAMLFFTFRRRAAQKNTADPELSKQEITVRNLILQGKTNKEIASELFISLSTVKTHITNLYGKLNITNRRELFQKHTGTST
ncbi:MAG: helix-turn-helix transcriptional regulator [Bacteroidota bacterium]